MKDYYEVRNWLENFIPQTYTRGELGLERIENLLEKLGNPHRKYKSILIAGTSGKGTTAFYTSRLLQFSGFKVGLHLSPHLVYVGERMQINGKNIPVKRLVSLVNEIKPVVDEIKSKQPQKTPSYFEILTALSFLYFAKEKVEWAVVEVGLGGRLDATNVLAPEVSVITNIGLDHTEILGDTICKIAFEKAGIIKTQTPVVSAAAGNGLKVIEKTAKEKRALLIKINTRYWKIESKKDAYINTRLSIDILRHSQNNAVLECMFLAFLAVSAAKIRLSKPVLKKTFSASFGGRFEEILPGVILDGAHNRDKIKSLIRYIKNSKLQILNTKKFTKSNTQILKKITLVVAFKKGKKWQEMITFLVKNLPVKKVYATQFSGVTDMGKFSAVSPFEIKKFLMEKGIKAKAFRNPQEAVFEAISDAKNDEIILVTGSLYLVGEAQTLFKLPSFAS